MDRSSRLFIPNNASGFSLLELIMVVALSGLISGAAYAFYNSQIKTRVTQDRVVDMQQNIRSAMLIMGDDIRMAGYDPMGVTGAAITLASADALSFSMGLDGDANGMDDDGDGTVDEADEAPLTESISYTLADMDSDGDQDIFRGLNGGAGVMIAENVEAWEFNYVLSDGSFESAPSDASDIIAVRVALLMRASRPDAEFTNRSTYAGYTRTWGPYNDGYRRRLLRRTIRCRNRGL